MYGPHIEKQFQHVTLENEQLRRKLEMLRMLEAAQPQQPRPGRSLVDFFGRFVTRLDLRPARRSPITSS